MILSGFVVLAIALLSASVASAQQLSPRNANYTIDVTLDARARTLTGRETLVWTNTSAASTTELQFHLYYNAWGIATPPGCASTPSHRGGRSQARDETQISPLSTSR